MNFTRTKLTRRSILETAWKTLTTAAVAGSAGSRTAYATRSNGRALVCIYLFGGNDANNVIVPLSQYSSYASARRSLAIPQDQLLSVSARSTQEGYGFHPAMPELQALFQSGTLGVVSNIGRTGGAGPLDPALRYVRPGYAVPGWAAEIANVPSPSDGSILESLPPIRDMVREVGLPNEPNDQPPAPIYAGFPDTVSATRPLSRNPTTSLAVVAPGVKLSGEQRDRLWPAMKDAASSLRTGFPATGLGFQLYQAAGLLKARRQFGIGNAVFSCALGGFSTSANQLDKHAALLAELSSAMSAFYRATEEMGIAQSVTTYTDSEHSRTLKPNANLGSDPAWGGHHLVMGGAVLGGDVHGRFPSLTLGGPDDVSNLGVFKPSVSKDEYAATFASWFGLEYPELVRTLPRVTRSSRSTLGFLAG